MTTTTVQWLEAAGLSPDTCAKVASLSLGQLRRLMISDYERYGVRDMAEKQRLFRVLQASHVGTPPSTSPQLTPQHSGPGASEDDATLHRQCASLPEGLVDLELDDDDFLTQVVMRD